MNFSSILLNWYAQNRRNLPWRTTDNPYVIWIAEVVFQQTRIDQGLPYFLNFIDRFPTIEELAKASETEVLKMWQGLGYYSRARNLHFSAKYIVNELNGKFPDTYDEILKLKGVGPYIAAEVASVCFNLPYAAVDGNVQRVISRVFGVEEPVNGTLGKKIIQAIADEHLSQETPGDFNQALMDFGSGICTPKKPSCSTCGFAETCFAFRNGLEETLPLKLKKTKSRNRYFNYVLIHKEGKFGMSRRKKGDVWEGLYEPYLMETKKEVTLNRDLNLSETAMEIFSHKRVLSHQNLYLKFWVDENGFTVSENTDHLEWYSKEELHELPVPKSIEQLFTSKVFSEFDFEND